MAAGKEKISKQYILDRLEDDEVDLSTCELTSFPVKELVSLNTYVFLRPFSRSHVLRQTHFVTFSWILVLAYVGFSI